MTKLDQLRNEVLVALENITQGGIYVNHTPKKERGFQYDLYLYLKDKGYDIVYELELPNIGQYTEDEDINEVKTFAIHKEGSLVPDLVVDLGDEGFACFELKYNETDSKKYNHDGDKCRVYVEHCKDVHYAGFIDLLNATIDGREVHQCKDPNYKFHYYYYHDTKVSAVKALEKFDDAYPIRELWEEKLRTIQEGKAEFSEFENANYKRNIL